MGLHQTPWAPQLGEFVLFGYGENKAVLLQLGAGLCREARFNASGGEQEGLLGVVLLQPIRMKHAIVPKAKGATKTA